MSIDDIQMRKLELLVHRGIAYVASKTININTRGTETGEWVTLTSEYAKRELQSRRVKERHREPIRKQQERPSQQNEIKKRKKKERKIESGK